MTGNKNAWRAPLAGLASVAMIATMGVVASTANAAVANGVYGMPTYPLNVQSTAEGSKSVVYTNGVKLEITGGKTFDASYKFTDGKADGYVYTGMSLKQENGKSVDPAKDELVEGWDYIFTANFTKGAKVEFKDADGNVTDTQEALQGGTVTVPGTGDYYEYNGNVYASGQKITVDVTGDVVASKVSGVVVTFDADGGQFAGELGSVSKKAVDGKVSLPATPVKADATFAGWALPASGWNADESDLIHGKDGLTYVYDIADVTFSANATVTAVWNKLDEQMVTFHYGSYKGAPEDSAVKVAPNETVTVPASPKRDGYLFKGWFLGDKQYNAKTDLAGDFFKDAAKPWTLTAKWERPSKQSALDALTYVVAIDDATVGVSGAEDHAKAFTSASWDEFTKVYEKALVEFKQTKWDQHDGDMTAEAAQSIITELQDAWKDLRFNTSKVDTTIDLKKDAQSGAEMVYRLATPDGQRHFMTADENEVLARTNVISGLPAWNLEPASSFRMVNGEAVKAYGWTGEAAEGDKGSVKTDWGYEVESDQTGSPRKPLVKTVTRLYNSVSQEHLYTTSPAEVTNLTKIADTDWGVDSASANLYTPALYSTSKEVARFYNEKTGLHFYTTDKAEINFWTVQHPGIWTKETTGIYAL